MLISDIMGAVKEVESRAKRFSLEIRRDAAVDAITKVGAALVDAHRIDRIKIDYSNHHVDALYKVNGVYPKIRVNICMNTEYLSGSITDLPSVDSVRTRNKIATGKLFPFMIGIAYETRHMDVDPGVYVEMNYTLGTADDIHARVLECVKHVKEFCSKEETYLNFLRTATLLEVQKKLSEEMTLNHVLRVYQY